MNRTVAYCVISSFVAVSLIFAAVRPEWTSDANAFFAGFVNQEFLNILGVILAITLASTANIHLVFNGIEERFKSAGALSKSRKNLKTASYGLIALFVIGVIIVAIKPVACGGGTCQSLFNMAAMLVLLLHILILITLTEVVFRIEPIITDSDLSSKPQAGPNARQV